jgi:hypothetical protein
MSFHRKASSHTKHLKFKSDFFPPLCLNSLVAFQSWHIFSTFEYRAVMFSSWQKNKCLHKHSYDNSSSPEKNTLPENSTMQFLFGMLFMLIGRMHDTRDVRTCLHNRSVIYQSLSRFFSSFSPPKLPALDRNKNQNRTLGEARNCFQYFST